MAQTAEQTDTAALARAYFDALARQDLDAAVALWRPGGEDRLIGIADLTAPDGIRGFFVELFGAFPDFRFEIVDQTTEGARSAVRWRTSATFAGPGLFQGIEPTGARVSLEGCDVVEVEDGEIVRNTAFLDGADLARQLGVLPPKDSRAEQRMGTLVNRRIRVARRLAAAEPERVAEGVWVVRGGFPMKTMNVFLVRDGDGVLLFDAGIGTMTNALATAGARLGGITRIVLGHSHADHRGAAAGLAPVPVFCHPAERADAEGDGGAHYIDFSMLKPYARAFYKHALPYWDGGPVEIAGTVEEGDDVAGFRVVHLPGHAPGMIGLWRESDRLALTSDAFYLLDVQTTLKGPPRVPEGAFNADTEEARASIRKLAALAPAAAWPGHLGPLTGDVRSALETAAATT